MFDEIQSRLYGADFKDHNLETIETEIKNRKNDQKKEDWKDHVEIEMRGKHDTYQRMKD